ncbi:hypothetical protein [Streptomyces sp. NPDC097610]|uniref:hypothetical protein n=1 Tax=Streptomyces sp. NPDC097610 TaxID=3157227 RepID=UPI00332BC0DD
MAAFDGCDERTGPEGRPCYPITDGNGHLPCIADTAESVRLGRAGALLDPAADLLAGRGVTAAQLRVLAGRMAESLRDVHRIRESRGARFANARTTFGRLNES